MCIIMFDATHYATEIGIDIRISEYIPMTISNHRLIKRLIEIQY